MILLKNLFNIYLIKKMINKDFKRRRDFLLNKIEDNSIVFLFSGLEKSRNNDVNYKFRQSSNFFYLTGINNPSMLLVITKISGRYSTTLVCDRPNDIDKIWHGQLPSKSSYKNQFEIQNVLYFDELNSLELNNAKNMYFEFSDENRLNQFIENLNLSQPQSRYLRNNTSRSTKIDLSNILFDMRRIKSKSEVSLIRHAAKISANAHINIMKSCKPGL